MSAPVSERSKVRDAIVAILQDPVNCPNLAPLTTLKPDNSIATTSIIGWQAGDIGSLTDSMIAANGIVVIVMVSSGKEMNAEQNAPTLDTPVTILITEQVEQNRGPGGSGLPADYVAEQVLAQLKNWQVPESGYLIIVPENATTIADGSPLRNLFTKDAESPFFTQIVNLATRTSIEPRLNS